MNIGTSNHRTSLNWFYSFRVYLVVRYLFQVCGFEAYLSEKIPFAVLMFIFDLWIGVRDGLIDGIYKGISQILCA